MNKYQRAAEELGDEMSYFQLSPEILGDPSDRASIKPGSEQFHPKQPGHQKGKVTFSSRVLLWLSETRLLKRSGLRAILGRSGSSGDDAKGNSSAAQPVEKFHTRNARP